MDKTEVDGKTLLEKAREFRKNWSHKPEPIPTSATVGSGLWYSSECTDELLTLFAQQAIEDEREACAKIADVFERPAIAKAIRSRGEKGSGK